MRLLLDIRQAIAASDINQAQARLLLANLRSRESRAVLVSFALDCSLAICA